MKWNTLAFAASSALAVIAALPQSAYAEAYATPTKYEVTVQQVELCEDTDCSRTVVLGTSTEAFDIASGSAGTDIGSYTDTGGLTPGTTYTAVKVTLSRSIVMNGSTGDPGGAGGGVPAGCSTSSNNDFGNAAAYGTLADGAEGGAAEDQTLVAPNPSGAAPLADISAGYTNSNITIADDVAGMTVTYPLTTSYTAGYVQPRVEVSFDVTNALASINDGTPKCLMFPKTPTVTVSVTDP